MSDWQTWANNICALADGAALYCPSSGAIYAKSGEFDCSGAMSVYDKKAKGEDASAPNVNGKKFMFIRNTSDDEPASLFKQGQDNVVTMKGPGGSRIALFIKDKKPEAAISAVTNYVKDYV